MAISDKDRRSLWAKSGNRFAICKTELFTKAVGSEVNVGEECHIISKKSKGPRHKYLSEYDVYNNYLLLCRNHHKMIDELTDTYTEELLRYIKSNHEMWVSSSLSENKIKEKEPKFLFRISSGKELSKVLDGAHGLRTDYDNIDNEKEAEYIGNFAQDLLNYLDMFDMAEPYDKAILIFNLNKLIEDVEYNGYYIFGERDLENFRFGKDKSEKVQIATIVIKKRESADIIKID